MSTGSTSNDWLLITRVSSQPTPSTPSTVVRSGSAATASPPRGLGERGRHGPDGARSGEVPGDQLQRARLGAHARRHGGRAGEPLRQRDEPDRPRLVAAVAPPTHGRVEAPDAVDVVLGEAPPDAAVRREHDGAGHRRVPEAEQVTGLVEGDGLDVERTPGPREAPGLGVVEVELPGVTAA